MCEVVEERASHRPSHPTPETLTGLGDPDETLAVESEMTAKPARLRSFIQQWGNN